MKYDLEKVYDEQISPLMDKIIAICKENAMPMLATFQYSADDDGKNFCTTLIQPVSRGDTAELALAGKLILDGPPSAGFVALRISGRPNA